MIPYTGSLDTPLIRAIIEIEDARYYSHHGINILAKL
jgi:membrane carboxypeptidase/penicillin-binding protein